MNYYHKIQGFLNLAGEASQVAYGRDEMGSPKSIVRCTHWGGPNFDSAIGPAEMLGYGCCLDLGISTVVEYKSLNTVHRSHA